MKSLKFSVPIMICALLVGCSAEKSEGKRFCALLNKQARVLDGLNSQEATVMQSLQSWSGQQAFMGGGSAMPFGGGMVSAFQTQASHNARNFKAQLASLRAGLASLSQELSAEQLKAPYIQTVRSGLVQALDSRSRLMGDLDPLLEDYARGIVNPNLQIGMHPVSIDTIAAKVRGHQTPTNNVAQALQELRTKYSISDSDIAN